MKYNDPEKWNLLKTDYRDIRNYNKLIKEAGNLNIKGVPVKKINRLDVSEYEFKNNHINIEREHDVTKMQAQEYINNSVAAYKRWNGAVTVYISPKGAAVVNTKERTVSTAYSASQYDSKFKKLLEVLGYD